MLRKSFLRQHKHLIIYALSYSELSPEFGESDVKFACAKLGLYLLTGTSRIAEAVEFQMSV
jgi:hypothetical protein